MSGVLWAPRVSFHSGGCDSTSEGFSLRERMILFRLFGKGIDLKSEGRLRFVGGELFSWTISHAGRGLALALTMSELLGGQSSRSAEL